MLCIDCKARPMHARMRCNACYLVYRRSAAFARAYAPKHQSCWCGEHAEGRGLCWKHYMQAYRQEQRRANH